MPFPPHFKISKSFARLVVNENIEIYVHVYGINSTFSLQMPYFESLSNYYQILDLRDIGFFREFSSESRRILFLDQVLGVFSIGNSGLTIFQD